MVRTQSRDVVPLHLVAHGWMASGRLRLIAFPLALFFLPVLGALSVGQYDFPVLLGTSLLIYSLRKENVALTTLGAVLLTFKPHIGALILLSVLGWLIRKQKQLRAARDAFHPDGGNLPFYDRLYCRSGVDRQLSKNVIELSERRQCDSLLRMCEFAGMVVDDGSSMDRLRKPR